MDEQLRASYRRCRRMLRRHDPTYALAVARLPADVRPAVHALYGFVRGADEIVDGRTRRLPAERRAALDEWEHELRRGLAAGSSEHPVIAALVDAAPRHGLPLGELDAYMRSMRIDCGPVRIETRAELERYMEGSAGAVGRILAPLLGAPAERRAAFGRLGLAFQLTNFIRDVRDDYRLDRVYLPLEDRARHDVTEAEIGRGEATPGFRRLLAEEVAWARDLFAEGAPAVDSATPSVRAGMRFARAAYLRILDRAEASDFDVLGRRVALSPWQLAGAAVSALRSAA